MSPSQPFRPTIRHNAVFLAAIVACGAWLRCWHLGGQLLLDDEWHALNFVQGKDFLGVLFGQGLGANSIPVNLWAWILLKTSGWSELGLRLPSLVAGIAAVVVIPLLVRRLSGGFVWIAVAAAMAVSPVLVFYSRVARPYAPACLFGAASVLLAAIWMKERKTWQSHVGVLSGALAVWWHLYSVIPVGSALLVTLALACRSDYRAGETALRGYVSRYLAPVLLFVVPLAVLVGIPNVLNPWWLGVFSAGERATAGTLWEVFRLGFGTGSAFLVVFCLGLLLRGWMALYAKERPLFLVLGAGFALYFVVAALNRQDGSHTAIQVVRYGIVYLPLLLLVAGAGLSAVLSDAFGEKAARAWPVALVLSGVLYLAGPLPRIYVEPNNFTSHSAFQYVYDPMDWSRSRVREFFANETRCFPQEELPPFYRSVRDARPGGEAVRGIVEYPVFLGDHFNYLYYFQHFHGLPVAAGYMPGLAGRRFMLSDGFICGNNSIDEVLASPPIGSHWKTMVDIREIGEMRGRYRGWVLVVHKDPEQEICAPWSHVGEMASLVKSYDGAFGGRVYEDARIACWLIR
ncbi:MAG TPA: hypothetical protein VGK27_12595 [Candidatus Deferrimicrobiaceae bacterium]